MKKDNKIISFEKRNKVDFKLKAKISIQIKRQDERFTLNWYSPDKALSEEQMYLMQLNILQDLTKDVEYIIYKEKESYETEITLLYYEKNSRKFKYICIPQDIKKEKLIEYLMVSTSLYETKKTGAR